MLSAASSRTQEAAPHIIRIARVTTPFWLLMILLFVLTTYLDAARGTTNFAQLMQVYGLGFLPWLVAAPVTVFLGIDESRRRPGWLRMLMEVSVLAAGITVLILANMVFVIAPFWGLGPVDILAANSFREWIWDLLIFAVALLSGHVLGAAHRSISATEQGGVEDKIMVRSASRVDIVDVADIIAASAQGNYVALVTEKAEYLHRVTLGEMKALLAGHGFVQVHRSHLVRVGAIESVKRGGVPYVMLQGGKQIPVSPSGKQALSAVFERPPAAA